MRRTWSLLLLLPSFLALFLAACQDNHKLTINKEIKPSRGPYLGGDPVTITGTGFSTTQDIKIYFGDKAAKAPVIRENGEIVVEPPAGDVGKTVDVVIVFQDLSKSVTLRNAYTYIDPTDIKKPDEKK